MPETDSRIEILRQLLDKEPLSPQGSFKPGRVMFTIGSLHPGGAERQMALVVALLSGHGYCDLHVHCHSLATAEEQFHLPTVLGAGATAASLGSELFRLDAGRRKLLEQGLSDDALYLPLVLRYMHDIASVAPSVLHIWLDMPEALLAALLLGVPHIVLAWRNVPPYNFDFYNPMMHTIYLSVIRRQNLILTNNSKAGGAVYAEWLGLDASRIMLYPNAIDVEAWPRPSAGHLDSFARAMGIPAGKTLVGGIFRFSGEKQPLLWLDSAAAILQRQPHSHFVLFGAGPLEQEMRNRIKNLRLDKYVTLAGITKDVALALGLFDVLLLTSRVEGLPNVLLEAQALGVPVVTTPAGGAPETILAGVTGQVTENFNPENIADAVMVFLKDAALRARAKERGPSHIRASFSPEALLAATLSFYGWGPDAAPPRARLC